MMQINNINIEFRKAFLIPIMYISCISTSYYLFFVTILNNNFTPLATVHYKILAATLISFTSIVFLQIFSIRLILKRMNTTVINFKKMATTDLLTSMLNRHALCHTYMMLSKRSHITDNVIVILDIDKFKLINDEHGHACGDTVLQQLGHLIKGSMRGSDSCYRIGGEEFALLLLETPLPKAMLFIENMRSSIANTPIVHDEHIIKTTCTFGVATIDFSLKLEENMRMADDALYNGKKKGRNTVMIYKEAAKNE
jgi:diguanylate cyclase (GGDEF)-like protein